MTAPVLFALIYSVFAAGLFAAAAFWAAQHYRQLPTLTDSPVEPSHASVDVIIPARNEVHTITRVVSSLIAQRYPTFSVTVVDDHSTDHTAEQALSAGAHVIRLETEPPAGWTGKCNACEQGARRATGDWLLFTDADTFHTPVSLAQAVSYAETHALDALSLLLRQECVGLWDKAILPLAYQFYFAALRPDQPIFNGQYILIRRLVYEQSGGFGLVHGRVMEDVALAEALARQNYRIALVNGERAAGVRMYENFRALWSGLTKTTFAAARDRGASGWLLGALTSAGVGIWIVIGCGLFSAQIGVLCAGLLVWLLNAVWLTLWMRRFDVRPAFAYALLNLPALLVLWLIGVYSTLRALTRIGIRWKDRLIFEIR